MVKDVPQETQISIKWEKMGANGMFTQRKTLALMMDESRKLAPT